jgi:hypothetical protein
MVSGLSGLGADVSLVVVSNVCLLASCVLLAAYARHRLASEQSAALAVMAFALMPPTFFFHMAYSESLFLLVCLLVFWGIERRWPLLVVAFFVGLGTATRPVGVALIAPLLLHIWQTSSGHLEFVRRIAWAFPLSVWGLVGFIAYLQADFQAPLAFAQTQENYRMRPPVDAPNLVAALLTAEPIWSVYVSSSTSYWKYNDVVESPFFSLLFVNPIYFLGFGAVLIWGAARRWITLVESSLLLLALFIPYFTRSFDMCMASQARFACAAFPAYLVIGRFLDRLPVAIQLGLAAVAGTFLATYSALFTAGGYRLF